jgi:hypothetical protein
VTRTNGRYTQDLASPTAVNARSRPILSTSTAVPAADGRHCRRHARRRGPRRVGGLSAASALQGRPGGGPPDPQNYSDRAPPGRHVGRLRRDARPSAGGPARFARLLSMHEYVRAACPLPPACAFAWAVRLLPRRPSLRSTAKAEAGGRGPQPQFPPLPRGFSLKLHACDVPRNVLSPDREKTAVRLPRKTAAAAPPPTSSSTTPTPPRKTPDA